MSKCGWAFSSVTRPCVAQRVWPMPVVAGGAATATPPPSSLARSSTAARSALEVADRAHGVELRPRTGSRCPRSRSRGTRASAGPRAGSPAPGAVRRSRRCRTWARPPFDIDRSDRGRAAILDAERLVLRRGLDVRSGQLRPRRARRGGSRRFPPPRPSAPRPSRARAARCRSGAAARGRGPRARPPRARPPRGRSAAPSSASRSRTRTLTSVCGSFSIAWRSCRSPPSSASMRQQRGGDAVAGRDEAHVDDVAGLLAAERPAALAQRLEHVAVADVGGRDLDARRRAIAVWKP